MRTFFAACFIILTSASIAQTPKWEDELLAVCGQTDSAEFCFVNPYTLQVEKWDQLAQPRFWQKIMRLSPDSCIVNIGATRHIIEITSLKTWNAQSDERKNAYRDSVRLHHGLAADEKIFVTTGKNDFYRFDAVIPTISRGIEVFRKYNVDPWYAQAILLIESPGKLAKSSAGAYGPFQLMKGVAIQHGLTVNGSVDERKDFDKSAMAASSLIGKICIPEARRILNAHQIVYNEQDTWFRLFVLHIYHAGAGNVAQVVQAISPTSGGMELITKMWQTKAGHFGNSSQNYSQLALASFLVLGEMIDLL
jgi:hypothetical protein